MKLTAMIIVLSALIAAGCATDHVKRGQVVMKTSERVAHVALASDEVKVGDHVELYYNQCKASGGEKGTVRNCKKIAGGHGTVTALFDPDYSEVEFPEGTKFGEGDTVERHAH